MKDILIAARAKIADPAHIDVLAVFDEAIAQL